jgi:hypothetical protein
MTFTEPRSLDLITLATLGTFDGAGREPSGDLHLLRLALDLQLDAMLLTLGAAAHAESRGDDLGAGVPWQRWLGEDLELARTLATALLDGDSPPLPGLGGGLTADGVEASLDHLVARYSSMENLLCDVLNGPHHARPWRAATADALARCRVRLDELHVHRRDVIATSAVRSGFLPGELLG